jgi:hypothetical protein
MKIGVRKPSLNKRISARTSVKRYARHSLGLKAPRGMGWITNPKKAMYNRMYYRSTVSSEKACKAILQGIFVFCIFCIKLFAVCLYLLKLILKFLFKKLSPYAKQGFKLFLAKWSSDENFRIWIYLILTALFSFWLLWFSV